MGNFRDGYLVQGEPLGNIVQDAVLIADDQIVILNNKTAYLRLTSDNTTAANRTFSFQNGWIVGQILYLSFESGSSTKAQLLSSGNCVLSATWAPDQYDTLTLLWSGNKWLKIGRSTNA